MSAVESKEKVKILQADAIRREYPIVDIQKRWQNCQTFIDVLGKGYLSNSLQNYHKNFIFKGEQNVQ